MKTVRQLSEKPDIGPVVLGHIAPGFSVQNAGSLLIVGELP